MGWLYAILLKPFILLGFFMFVRSIELLTARLPEGKVRRLLLRKF